MFAFKYINNGEREECVWHIGESALHFLQHKMHRAKWIEDVLMLTASFHAFPPSNLEENSTTNFPSKLSKLLGKKCSMGTTESLAMLKATGVYICF